MTPPNQIPSDESALKRRISSDNTSVDHVQEAGASSRPSEAATLNQRVLKKLQRSLADNLEVDLLSLFPTDYSTRLKLRIGEPGVGLKEASEPSKQARKKQSEDDIRFQIACSCPAEEIYPLSPSIHHLFTPANQTFDGSEVSCRLSELLWKCEVICRGPIPEARTVFQLGSEAVIKVVSNAHDYTEYTTLQYLDRVLPEFPAPKPLGVLRIGHLSFIFATYIPGRPLQDVWPALTRDQKLSIKDKLQEILLTLRSVRRQPEQPLGGLQGEGCKVLRRNLRHISNPIHTVEQHDDFLFSNALFGSQVYLDLLRKFALGTSSQIRLSHGDIRPDNIIVQEEENGMWVVSGIIDWEFSGFYPCHYESTKATNCLSTDETSDWYEYLPELLSPVTWGRRWLLDYVLGRILE